MWPFKSEAQYLREYTLGKRKISFMTRLDLMVIAEKNRCNMYEAVEIYIKDKGLETKK